MTTRNRALGGGILLVGLVVLLLGLSLNASILFDTFAPPAVSYQSPLRVLNNPVTAGGTLVLEVGRTGWNITGNDPIPADVSRQLVRVDADGRTVQPTQIVVLPSVAVGVPPGASVVQSRLSIIPADLPPGYWRLEGLATARRRTSPYWTEPIAVRAP